MKALNFINFDAFGFQVNHQLSSNSVRCKWVEEFSFFGSQLTRFFHLEVLFCFLLTIITF